MGSTPNPEAELAERLSHACETLRMSVLDGTDEGVAESKRLAVMVAMSRLLDEFGLSDIAGEVLAARDLALAESLADHAEPDGGPF